MQKSTDISRNDLMHEKFYCIPSLPGRPSRVFV